MPLEPILEIPRRNFFEKLDYVASKNPKFSSAVKEFPVYFLLKYSFHSAYSSYWPEKALQWLSFADRDFQMQFKEELDFFSKNKLMSQSSRQSAQKILKLIASCSNSR